MPAEATAELPTRARAHPLRAGGVAAAWIVGALPALIGLQRCIVAAVFHVPCPGCGMTRAVMLLASGNVQASLRMHPLAVPSVVAGMALIASTIATTFATGNPTLIYRSRAGQAAIALFAAVYAAVLALWILRWFGFAGGPVPVG